MKLADPVDPVSREFFEAKYQRTLDPWAFASSSYEQNRYDEIMAAVDNRRFRRAFEPGCSIGVLTERLASICDHVNASDVSPTAVARAAQRCSRFPRVTFDTGALPSDLPEGPFDLIVLSEVGYYLTAPALRSLAIAFIARLEPAGVLLAAHWLGNSPDHILSGDEVHDILNASPGCTPEKSRRYEGFRVDTWGRR
jgi:trans-aconitate methyltransferase